MKGTKVIGGKSNEASAFRSLITKAFETLETLDTEERAEAEQQIIKYVLPCLRERLVTK
jgi:hypothetical protein